MTLEGTVQGGHNCTGSFIGVRSMGEYRTSAWVCSGGCGVWISHWASDDEYEYLYDVVDSKGVLRGLSFGSPSQSVINSLKIETKWR